MIFARVTDYTGNTVLSQNQSNLLIQNHNEFLSYIKNHTKGNFSILCIDWGSISIGLASYYSENKVAVPSKTVVNDYPNYYILLKYIKEKNVSGIVIGIPIKENKEINSKSYNRIKHMAKHIQKSITIPITFMDEYSSSIEAKELFGKKDDSIEALVILQSFLRKMQLI